jgi:hypothetical protein
MNGVEQRPQASNPAQKCDGFAAIGVEPAAVVTDC